MAYHRWNKVSTDLLIYFSQDDAWTYITALRGPDANSNGDSYKRLVTAVIRGDCSDPSQYGIANGAYGMHNFGGYNWKDYSKEDILDAVKYAPDHAVGHAVMGLDVLTKWYIKQESIDDEAVKLLNVLHRSLYAMYHNHAETLKYAEDYRIAFYKFYEVWTGEKDEKLS